MYVCMYNIIYVHNYIYYIYIIYFTCVCAYIYGGHILDPNKTSFFLYKGIGKNNN